MIIFGGFVDGGERTNELWRFYFAENRWECIPSRGKWPKARAGHSAILRGNTMVIFGGCDIDNEKLNDLWIYNFENGSWTEILSDPVRSPLPRSGHSAALHNNLMLIFGGIFEVTKELNDLMAFDFATNQWVAIFEE